jgi:hypothetical protein
MQIGYGCHPRVKNHFRIRTLIVIPSPTVPVQHCKRATRSLDGRGPAPRPRFSPPETRRDEPGEPAGWSASLWLGALAACDVRVRVLGWEPCQRRALVRDRALPGEVQLAGPRSAD